MENRVKRGARVTSRFQYVLEQREPPGTGASYKKCLQARVRVGRGGAQPGIWARAFRTPPARAPKDAQRRTDGRLCFFDCGPSEERAVYMLRGRPACGPDQSF
eukprot:scaffold3166_cov399-Prasinococcus_capsulatus_cf.AAC.16